MASRLMLRRLRSCIGHRISAACDYNHTIGAPSHTNRIDADCHFRFFSSSRTRVPARPKHVDIGARARQLQTRRLWTYGLTISCFAGFIVVALSNFQDQLVFYITPTDALEKYRNEPQKSKFRLGGLVLEGSLSELTSSAELEFVVTDLVTDILVRYKGSLPDLFREGHSVVVEGYVKPFEEEEQAQKKSMVFEKARSAECYFSAIQVLAKHDEKYMPQEVAEAIEKNKKMLNAGDSNVQSAKA